MTLEDVLEIAHSRVAQRKERSPDMNLVSLPRIIIEPMVRHALAEDLGLAGDITSAAVIPEKHRSTVIIVARQSGVIAGLDMAELAFQLIDAELVMMRHVHDGMKVEPGDVIATITGCSRALLTAERTALNFLSHLSGIATATASIATAIAGTKTIVVCTRKTLPEYVPYKNMQSGPVVA